MFGRALRSSTRESYHPSDEKGFSLFKRRGNTIAGQHIDDYEGLRISAVYAALERIGNATSLLPWRVFQKVDRRSVNRDEHPVAMSLQREPRPFMAAGRFRKLMAQRRVWDGNFYAEIAWAFDRSRVQLWPIHPTRVTVKWDKAADEPVYFVRSDDGETYQIPAASMFHTMSMSRDGLQGEPLWRLALEDLGEMAAAARYAARYYRKDARPNIALKMKGELDDGDQERLRSSWNKIYGGDEGEGVAILEEGTELHEFSIPNEAAQFLETRTFHVAAVSRWTGVPPHMLAELSRATYSNIEQQGIDFVSTAVLPGCKDAEEEAGLKLFTEGERLANYRTKLDTAGLMRGDSGARSKYYSTMFGMGVLSVDEIRGYEDLDPLGPEEGGDLRLVPLNHTTLKRAAAGVDAKAPAGRPTAAPDNSGDEAVDLNAIGVPVWGAIIERFAANRARAATRRSFDAARHDAELVPKLRAALVPGMEAVAAQLAAGRPRVESDPTAFERLKLDTVKRMAEEVARDMAAGGRLDPAITAQDWLAEFADAAAQLEARHAT